MANDIIFQKISNISQSFYILINNAYIQDYNIYYYASQDLGNTLDLPQTFESNGCYVFASGVVSDLSQFHNNIQAFLSIPGNQNIVLLWIQNAEASETEWIYNTLSYTSKSSTQILIQMPASLVVRNQTISFNLYQNNPIYIQLSDDQNSFIINSDPNGFLGTYQLTLDGSFVTASFGQAFIGFSSVIAGCLEFYTTLDSDNMTLKFFFDNPTVPGHLSRFTYPVFSDVGYPVSFRVLNDLSNPIDPNRTLFAFMEAPLLPSYFKTNIGRSISLTPNLTDDINNTSSLARAKLVLAVDASSTTPNNTDPFYLTVSGAYTLSTPENSIAQNQRLQCGLSPIETVGFASGITQIYFLPGANAYASNYSPVPSTMIDDTASSLLSSEVKTSWGYLSQNSHNLTYFSQSEGGPLYAKILDSLTAENDVIGILDYIEIPLQGLSPVDLNTVSLPTTFPLVPYAGMQLEDFDGFTSQQCQDFENQVLSPVRRNQIIDLDVPPGPLGYDVQCLSPQGFLVNLNGRDPYAWTSVIPFKTEGQSFTLSNVQTSFQQALQSSQLFLVISSKEKFALNGATLINAIINVQDNSSDALWQFSLSPEDWFQTEDHHTMILFKFCGTSLYQLAHNTLLWTSADTFNNNVNDIQTELLAILQNAKDNLASAPEFASFVSMMDDPNWQGILFFNVKASFNTQSIPPSLQLLQSGLNPEYLYAHHLGINVTPVYFNTNQDLEQDDSSVFGLIDYNAAREVINYQNVTYQFKVQHLRGFIQQSQIQNLSAQISLYMLYFFGEQVSVSDNTTTPGSLLYLNGSFQNGSFSFVQPATNPVLKAHSHVIDEIELTQMRLGLVNLASSTNTGGQIVFQFDGKLRFKQLYNGLILSPFDVLSFGRDVNDTTRNGSLSFFNLILNVSYDYSTLTTQTFAFDASQVTLNPSQSLARSGSLYQHFPLTLKSFLQSDSSTPQSLGYSSVLTPSLNQSILTLPWYAIQYELNLGTMGDLAEQAGLTIDFIVGWAASPNAPNIFVGIKIPGVNESNQELLSIQNVLKLSIQSVQLSADTQHNYILAFKNIALKFFGKSLPPSGQTNITLFGDPNATGNNSTLGWYGAYAKRTAS